MIIELDKAKLIKKISRENFGHKSTQIIAPKNKRKKREKQKLKEFLKNWEKDYE